MAPCLAAGLSTSSICRTFPRALVYGPFKNQGLALPNVYTVQGIKHTLTVMECGYNMETLTGKLLIGNLEGLKLEGVGTPVFVTDFRRYGTLATSSWTKHTWQWLHPWGLRIGDHVGDLPLRRRGDKYVISAFYDANIRDSELVAANRYQLYLRVVTLADICDELGDHVTEAAWLDHRDTDRPHFYEWPAQPYPSGDWTIWRKAIAQAFIKPLSRSTAGTGSMDRPVEDLAMVPLRQRQSNVLRL
jgi:hypothetical protein